MAEMEVQEAIRILEAAGLKDRGHLGRAIYVVLEEVKRLDLGGPITPNRNVERQIDLAGLLFVNEATEINAYCNEGEELADRCFSLAERFCDCAIARYNLHHL